MCLWHCIAVYQGARPDRCTQLAKQLARGFFKLDIVPRTCLDELDKVEWYLNKGKQLREWIGIRVYEPERQDNVEIYWHLRKNPSGKLKIIMTIGIYEGHAFLIKDITKLTKTYVCNDCRGRFTQAGHLQRHTKTCTQGTTKIDCPNEKVKAPPTVYKRTFYDEGQASHWVYIFITLCAGTMVRGGYWEHRLTGMPRNRKQSSSIKVAGGMDAAGVLPTGTRGSPTAKREKNYSLRRWNEQEH